MRTVLPVLLLAFLAACGGASPKPDPDPALGNGGASDPPEPGRSELQVRQEAACEQAGPRLTECARQDTLKQPPEERAKADVEHTAPILTREFIKGCTSQYMSSRQVRVYEVCLAQETECEPLLTCLDNALPKK